MNIIFNYKTNNKENKPLLVIFKILCFQARCRLRKASDVAALKMDNHLKARQYRAVHNFNMKLLVKNKFQAEAKRDSKCSNKDSIFQINIESRNRGNISRLQMLSCHNLVQVILFIIH